MQKDWGNSCEWKFLVNFQINRHTYYINRKRREKHNQNTNEIKDEKTEKETCHDRKLNVKIKTENEKGLKKKQKQKRKKKKC